MATDEVFAGLLDACGRRSPTAAIRVVATYEPSAGMSTKVFPPTYPDVGYLIEDRYVDGVEHQVVALDSVQSEANRVEEALLEATEAGEITLPYIEVSADFDGGAFRVTSLDAPHRSPDAYFRDSVTADGTPFDDSDLGRRLRHGSERNARVFFEHSPTDLIFGIWDSQRGGRGLRLPRAYTSEIVALDPKVGVRAAGRLDPYNMQGGEVFYDKRDPSNWSFDKDGLSGNVKPTKGKPSNVNHGNALAPHAPGGVSVTSISRTAVISLSVLQRLRFPDSDASLSVETDAAARAVLAAIALVGDRLAFARASVFLRSGCDLICIDDRLEWVRGGGSSEPFELDVDGAVELLNVAVAHAATLGLAFASVAYLEPAKNLRSLIELNLSQPVPADED